MSADRIIAALGLQPHPEGGWFAEVWRDDADSPGDSRPRGTSILFLLRAGEVSHWHRLDAVEVWHFHAGSPVEMLLSPDGHSAASHRLGPDVLSGDRPQVVVPAGVWQMARSTGEYSLVGCTMAPGFSYAGWDLAPPGFDIPVRP